MKPIKFLVAAVVSVFLVIVVTVNIHVTKGISEENVLNFRNIEALAQGESGGWGCVGSGQVLCNGSYHYSNGTR